MRLNGRIEDKWCSSVLVPQVTGFNAAAKADCENHYLDPWQTPDSPATYAYDCSFGCRLCLYAQYQGGAQYYCKAESTVISGCPSPPPPSSPD